MSMPYDELRAAMLHGNIALFPAQGQIVPDAVVPGMSCPPLTAYVWNAGQDRWLTHHVAMLDEAQVTQLLALQYAPTHENPHDCLTHAG